MAAVVADPMVPVPYRVQRVRRDTHDTFTLELASSEATTAAFQPGQFNMLYVHGVGEVPISISGNPAAPETLVHTTRAVGTVTKAMAKLGVGDVIGIRGPFGGHWPVEAAEGQDVVIVAGGIGLAPLRPVIYHIMSHRERYGHVVLLYGTRSPRDILYRKELEQWGGRFDTTILISVDRASDDWHGHVGVVTNLISHAPFDPQHAVAYVCGPEIMMDFSTQSLERRGLAQDRIYISMERNMKCAIGYCGHCQWGPHFMCKDGPVFRFDQVKPLFVQREV
jgi:NAD(P)H-flavin reductase